MQGSGLTSGPLHNIAAPRDMLILCNETVVRKQHFVVFLQQFVAFRKGTGRRHGPTHDPR
jgi:hypothetical protein